MTKITRKPKKFDKSYAKIMKPLEQNIIEKINGNGIYLGKTEDFRFTKIQELKMKRVNYYFYNEGIRKSVMIKYFLIGLLSRLGIL